MVAEPPGISARRPARRHLLISFTPRTWAKERSTFVLPHVDIRADIDAIHARRDLYDHQTRQLAMNGRIMERESNGNVFPVAGEDFYRPAGRDVAAMRAHWRYNGIEDRAEYEISTQAISAAERDQARFL